MDGGDRPRIGRCDWRVAGEALDVAGIGMWIVREDGRIAAVNRTICDLLGIPEPELIGRGEREFEDGSGPAGTRLSKRDGGHVWVRVASRPVEAVDGVAHELRTIEDLGPVRRVEDSLHETEVLYRELFHRAPIGLGIADMQGNLIDFNEAMLTPGGYAREEIERIGNVARLYADSRQRDEALALVRARGRLERFLVRFLRKDGGTYDALMSLTPVRIRGRAYNLAMTEDVTAKLRLEEELARARRLEAVGRLAAGVAHDFNNLLQAIAGNVALAARQSASAVEPFLARAQQAIDRAGHLVHQLLAFGREVPLSIASVDVAKLLREVEGDLAPVLGKSIDLVVRMTGGSVAARADGAGLFHLLLNLGLNARDALQTAFDRGLRTRGTIVLEAEAVDVEDRPGAASDDFAPGRYVRIAVEDDGIGMDAATLEGIFDPFFTTKEVGKGTGLGLASAYGVVRQHGGWISVESRPGEGTRFALHVPAADALTAPAPPRSRVFGPAAGRRTVLVVDDEPMVREAARDLLQRAGHEVLEAADGERALEIYATQRDRIDVVVMDLTMPRMSGEETIVRLLAIRPDVRVLVATGRFDGTGIPGAAEVLRKPFRMDELLRAVAGS